MAGENPPWTTTTPLPTEDGLRAGMFREFEAGEGDFTIRCGTLTFKPHKLVLRNTSQYFANAIKPNTFTESANHEIIIHGDDPAIFLRMLRMVYLGEYENPEPDVGRPRFQTVEEWTHMRNERTKRAVQHAENYRIADKYQVPSLQQVAKSELRDSLKDPTDIFKAEVMKALAASDASEHPIVRELLVASMTIDLGRFVASIEFRNAITESRAFRLQVFLDLTLKYHTKFEQMRLPCPGCGKINHLDITDDDLYFKNPACWYCETNANLSTWMSMRDVPMLY